MNCPTCGKRGYVREKAEAAFPKPERVRGRGCRVSDRDEAAKVRLGYINMASFVRRDGSERLFGEDWARRKMEILDRGEGRCEQIVDVKYTTSGPGYYVRCKNEMHDPHHKIKRSTRRDDRVSNLIGLCRMHHDLL